MMKKFFEKFLLLFVILCVSTTVGCGEPEYSATASIIATNGAVTVHSDKTTVSASDLSASLYLADTVVDILNTPDIYIELADELGEEYDSKQLDKSINVERRSEDTLFIDITCTSSNPDEAVRIANKFAEISCEYIHEYIPHSIAKVASTAIKAGKKQGIF